MGATIYFCSFLVIASNIIMALFMAVSAEYVSYDLVVSDTALVTVGHLQRFQVPDPLQQDLSIYNVLTRSGLSASRVLLLEGRQAGGKPLPHCLWKLHRLLNWLQRAWSELDSTGSGYIQVWQLRRLVMGVGSPLGFRRPPARWWRLIR